jgi:hypothetical protein
MKRIAVATTLVLAFALPAAAQPPAIPKNPQIDIAYVPPQDPRHQAIHQRMTKIQILERFQQFLSPLKLDRKITVKMDQCGGAMSVPYQSSGTVTICYEHLLAIYNNLPIERAVIFGRDAANRLLYLTQDEALIGAVVQVLLHQTAYAVFDILKIPIWGSIDDAASNTAGFIMLEFGDNVAWVTLLGSAWFFAQRGIVGTGVFTDTVRQTDAQQFYNYLCLAYGASPNQYRFLVNAFNLPQGRANFCAQDYFRLRAAFRKTILPKIDAGLLKQVKAAKWLP